MTSKITAWYTDPESAQSGYRELNSNGHVETDLLDHIEDALAHKASPHAPGSTIRVPPAGPLYTPPATGQPGSNTPATAAAPAALQPAAKYPSASAAGESSSDRNTLPAQPSRATSLPQQLRPRESVESISSSCELKKKRGR